jgi:6-phosphogluconolactonase
VIKICGKTACELSEADPSLCASAMSLVLNFAVTLALIFSATACKKEPESKKSKSQAAVPATPTPTPAPTPTPFVPTGAAFFLSNPNGPNTVEAFSRNTATGLLAYLGCFPTGGNGTTAIQGSQAHAVVVNGDFLYAVNSGSDSFSTFRVGSDGRPVWLATTPSNGVRPVSIAVHGNLLFVLNQGIPAGDDGGPINAFVKGFVIGPDGLASPIPDATFEFDSEDMPSDVFFTGNGLRLAVMKSGANAISTFRVASSGELSDNESISVGSQPVGGAATSRLPWTGFAAVVEDPGAASVVSFFAKETPLLIVSQYFPPANTDIDPCWAVTNVAGDRLWTSNFKPRSLSLYSVNAESQLEFLTRWEPTSNTGPGSLDVEVSADGRFLYRLRAFSTVEGEPNPTPIVEVFEIKSKPEKDGVRFIQGLSPDTPISWTNASPTGMAVTSP